MFWPPGRVAGIVSGMAARETKIAHASGLRIATTGGGYDVGRMADPEDLPFFDNDKAKVRRPPAGFLGDLCDWNPHTRPVFP
ncbi:hypothetical protein [Cupriavidus necator]|uniref:hypothetical protein n=1 Tax=Cupriavidus necator TaxID=106590 RepID=UPI001F46D653|nr:hypothetical protein [Cupriavidus necator]